jgi:nitrate/nitrite transporter NarK
MVGLSTGFLGLLVLWSLMGGAQAGIFPCATKAIGATFHRTEQAVASGCLACCMAFGAAAAQYVSGRLFGPLTWQQMFALYAIPGLVWAVAFGLSVPRPDSPVPRKNPLSNAAPVRWSRLLTDPQMVLLCTQQFLRAAAVALFFTLFPRYLQETKGVTTAESGSLAALPLLAGMLGGLLGGFGSDWLLRRTGNSRLSRQGLAFAATTVCAGVSLAASAVADAETAVLLVSIAAFCGYLGGVSAYAVAISMGGKQVTLVFATMNMAGNVGAGLFPYAVRYLVKTTGNWNYTLPLFAALFAGAAVCWAFLNPKGTLFDEEPT